MLCLKERCPDKRNTQTRSLKKKNSSRFYSLGLPRFAARKVRFMCSSSLFSLVATANVVVAGLLTRSCQSYCDRLVMTGWGSPELLTHLFRTLPSTAKISLLDFLYRDILEQIEGSRMFGDTSENYRETRDNSCVILLKTRLNPVSHSTRTRS